MSGLNVGVNEPYKVDDASDYAVPVHGEQRGVPVVEIEIRGSDATAETEEMGSAAFSILRRSVDGVLGSL
jgi:predicted N-formylglutamate amidohydrolase